jgi:hypothetical protein
LVVAGLREVERSLVDATMVDPVRAVIVRVVAEVAVATMQYRVEPAIDRAPFGMGVVRAIDPMVAAEFALASVVLPPISWCRAIVA